MVCFVQLLVAQPTNEFKVEKSIPVFSRSNPNSIEIKWIPEDFNLWEQTKGGGYNVYRSEQGKKDFKKINAQPILMMDLNQIKTLIDSKPSQYMAMTYETLVALQKTPLSFDLGAKEGIKSIQEAQNDIDFSYMTIVLSSIYDIEASKALGWYYEDKNVVKGMGYEYYIQAVQSNISYDLSTEITIGKTGIKTSNFGQPLVKQYPGDTELTFAFELSEDIISWFGQKKNNSGEFINISNAPRIEFSGGPSSGVHTLIDTSLINYQEYYYRIEGIDIWGDTITLANVHDHPIDLTPPNPPFLPQPQHTGETEVTVSWELNNSQDSDLKGFVVSRSNNSQGPYSKIHESFIPKEKLEFIDSNFDPNLANYYQVYAIDTAGNYSYSNEALVALIDSIPPEAPIIDSAKISKEGIVRIKIKPSSSKDILGYKLLYANDSSHQFSVVQEYLEFPIETIPEIYTDTISLSTLTEKVYYRLIALDQHYNVSEPSELIILERPDIIPPARSIIRNYLVKKDFVKLIISPSNSRDVAGQNIYRKKAGLTKWIKIGSIKPQIENYIDKNIESDQYYNYYLTAIDEVPNESKPSPTVTIKTLPNDAIKQPKIKADFSTSDSKITITVQAETKLKEYKIAIYRKLSNQDIKLITYLEPNELTYLDNLNTKVKSATYQCKVIGRYDASLISEAAVINFN